MNYSHPQALRAFARRLERLLMLRSAVQAATVWFFVWGVAVMACKVAGMHAIQWLPLGALGFLPLAAAAAWREHGRQPAFATMRAHYDQVKACGGMMMAAEAADMSQWQAHLPAATVPGLNWRYGHAAGTLALAAGFMAAALWMPERFAHLAGRHALEIGPIVEQLQAEVKILEQEKIVDDQKAEEVQKQLAQLKQDSSAVDPDKTWEALDHIKESDSTAAKQAAEEAVAKTTALSEAETMSLAMEQAASEGMTPLAASGAAQNLAAMMKSANLESGLLQTPMSANLLSNLNGLSKQDLDNLMKALEANKASLSQTMAKLVNAHMIDPAKLAQCKGAGQCKNPGALADYLSSCTNGSCSLAECERLGKGGPGGGGPAAPMTWTDGTSEDGAKFQEHLLPQDTDLSSALLVGVSRTAPQPSADNLATASGGLDNSAGSGGSAHAQAILPEHRQAVQEFFKREPKN